MRYSDDLLQRSVDTVGKRLTAEIFELPYEHLNQYEEHNPEWERRGRKPMARAPRAQIIMRFRQGRTVYEIADELGVHYHTIRKWCQYYDIDPEYYALVGTRVTTD